MESPQSFLTTYRYFLLGMVLVAVGLAYFFFSPYPVAFMEPGYMPFLLLGIVGAKLMDYAPPVGKESPSIVKVVSIVRLVLLLGLSMILLYSMGLWVVKWL